MKNVSAFIVGLVFAIGLGISGMTRPEKVIGFLDFFGDWDISLAFVMVGGIAVYAITYRLARGSLPPNSPLLRVPTIRDIDARLLIGSAIFGVGWGLAGYCPGPALVSLGSASVDAAVLVAGMLGGMAAFAGVQRMLRPRDESWTSN